MTPHSRKLLFVLIAVFLPMAGSARPLEPGTASDLPPPHPWPSLDEARPDNGQQSPEELLLWLLSSDPAQRAEAQARLLPYAHEWLPPGWLSRLELLAASTRDEQERGHVLEFLQVLTWHGMRVERLGPYPKLAALIEEDVERGRQLVAEWRKVRTGGELQVDLGGGWCAEGRPPPRLIIQTWRLERLRSELAPLGGLALPALEHLLVSGSPPERLSGIALAHELRLHPSPDVMARLLEDPASVEVDAEEPTRVIYVIKAKGPPPPPPQWIKAQVTLSQCAPLLERKGTDSGTGDVPVSAVRSAENRMSDRMWLAPFGTSWWLWTGPDSDWVLDLRRLGADRARDEQEYWNRARPLWRAWWRTRSEDWLDSRNSAHLRNSYQGYQWNQEPRADKKALVRVLGPAGTQVQVIYKKNSQDKAPVIRRGTLPLSLNGPPSKYLAEVRMKRGDEWVDAGLRLSEHSQPTTIWLNPELFRQHLANTRETP